MVAGYDYHLHVVHNNEYMHDLRAIRSPTLQTMTHMTQPQKWLKPRATCCRRMTSPRFLISSNFFGGKFPRRP